MSGGVGLKAFEHISNPNIGLGVKNIEYTLEFLKKGKNMKLFKVKYTDDFSYAIVHVVCENIASIPLIEKETGFELESIEVVKGRLTIVEEI